jgi:hypothetical protein
VAPCASGQTYCKHIRPDALACPRLSLTRALSNFPCQYVWILASTTQASCPKYCSTYTEGKQSWCLRPSIFIAARTMDQATGPDLPRYSRYCSTIPLLDDFHGVRISLCLWSHLAGTTSHRPAAQCRLIDAVQSMSCGRTCGSHHVEFPPVQDYRCTQIPSNPTPNPPPWTCRNPAMEARPAIQYSSSWQGGIIRG